MDPVANGLSPILVQGDHLASTGTANNPQSIRDVGVEFESVFLSMMLKEMRNSLENGGFFGEESSDTYGGMFDLFIGKHVAEGQPLGIAQMLLEQYQRTAASTSTPGEEFAANAGNPSESASLATIPGSPRTSFVA